MKMILKVKDGVDLDVLLKYGFRHIGSTYNYYEDYDYMDLFIDSEYGILIIEYSALSTDILDTILKMIKDGILEIIEKEVEDVI